MNYWKELLLLVAGLTPITCLGVDLFGINVHGSVSQGFLYTTDNEVYGTSSDGSFDFTEASLNLSKEFERWPNLRLVLQTTFRRAGLSDELDLPRADYGFADYRFSFEGGSHLGVRLGRILYPMGLYGETRDILAARPSILMPLIYFDVFGHRNVLFSGDGGALYGRYYFGTNNNHALSFTAGVAEPRDNEDDFRKLTIFVPDNEFGEYTGNPIFVGRTMYTYKDELFKFGFFTMVYDREFQISVPGFVNGNLQFNAYQAFLQYNLDKWSFTSEYFHLDETNNLISGEVLPFTENAWYIQTEYRFNPKWTAVARYEKVHLKYSFPDPEHRKNHQDITVGLRWNFAPNWILAGEYHWNRGTSELNPFEQGATSFGEPLLNNLEDDWGLFALMLSYRF